MRGNLFHNLKPPPIALWRMRERQRAQQRYTEERRRKREAAANNSQYEDYYIYTFLAVFGLILFGFLLPELFTKGKFKLPWNDWNA